MSTPLIKRNFNVKKMTKFGEDLLDRGEAFKRHVTHGVAKSALNEIMSKFIPDKETGNYVDELDIRWVKIPEPAYAILHSGRIPVKKVSDLDAETTVLYIKPVTTRASTKTQHIYSLLESWSPFTVYTWPPVLPKDRAFVVFRTVRKDEVDRVKKKNIEDMDNILLELNRSGVRLKKENFVVQDIEAVSDLSFQIIRKEFGIGQKKYDVWRRALKRAKSTKNLNELIDKISYRTMIDPNYFGWHNLGKIKKRVDFDDLKDIEDFQDAITGR